MTSPPVSHREGHHDGSVAAQPDHHGAAEDTSVQLAVSGMTCNNCARHVTEAIQSVPGVRSASVSLETGRATVRWNDGSPTDLPAVLTSIQQAGYDATVAEKTTHDHDHKPGWQLNLWIGVLGTAPLMIGEWGFGLAMTPWFQWVSFALAGVVQVVAGAPFYRGAWRQLKVGSSNMDTLVALGSTTAFGFSVWVLFSGHGGHVFFMEAAAIITLISVGHWIEARVSTRASSALQGLLNLAPQTARRLSLPAPQAETSLTQMVKQGFQPAPQPTESEVPVAQLRQGDLVVLRPGDHVPTDGTVTEGDSAVDEAMLTGESAPADKKPGSTLYAGTVNLNGRLVMRVTATGEATALANIIAAVQRAQTSRADIQRLGDRVSNVFVPVVVAVAVLTALWWALLPGAAGGLHAWLSHFLWTAHVPHDEPIAAAFVCAAAVLIVACPCAMGLATPAAIMAAANAAARRGILIRDGVALEKAGTITAIVFDKTGTLTVGKPEVVQMALLAQGSQSVESVPPHPNPLPRGEGTAESALGSSQTASFAGQLTAILPLPGGEGRGEEKNVVGISANPFVAIAAALARSSTHPISQAVARVSSDKVALTDWREVRGSGVEARIAGGPAAHPARLGSLTWLQASGVDLASGENFIAEWSGQGATVVGLALDKTLCGLFAVKDTVKPGSAKVTAQLQRQGLKVYLLTGDNARTAAGIAKQTGIAMENVFAEVRPEQKAEFIKKLQAEGARVAFVGDGINDAPALEQADLGIAVSRASDVAREAADIILLKSDIEAVPEALGLARAALRTIKQNLFWAFFYNSLGVPLAALGFMSPVLCAAAMGFSDLIVIGNALRLRNWRMRE